MIKDKTKIDIQYTLNIISPYKHSLSAETTTITLNGEDDMSKLLHQYLEVKKDVGLNKGDKDTVLVHGNKVFIPSEKKVIMLPIKEVKDHKNIKIGQRITIGVEDKVMTGKVINKNNQHIIIDFNNVLSDKIMTIELEVTNVS